MAKKGQWVTVYNIVLTPEERAPQVPDDTKKVPLETWVKGFLMEDGRVGEKVEIETITGRRVIGKLVEVEASYTHSFGDFVPELLQVGLQLRELLFGGEDRE